MRFDELPEDVLLWILSRVEDLGTLVRLVDAAFRPVSRTPQGSAAGRRSNRRSVLKVAERVMEVNGWERKDFVKIAREASCGDAARYALSRGWVKDEDEFIKMWIRFGSMREIERECGKIPVAFTDMGFMYAAKHGRLNVLEWLRETCGDRIDPTAEKNYAFRLAAENGHLPVLE